MNDWKSQPVNKSVFWQGIISILAWLTTLIGIFFIALISVSLIRVLPTNEEVLVLGIVKSVALIFSLSSVIISVYKKGFSKVNLRFFCFITPLFLITSLVLGDFKLAIEFIVEAIVYLSFLLISFALALFAVSTSQTLRKPTEHKSIKVAVIIITLLSSILFGAWHASAPEFPMYTNQIGFMLLGSCMSAFFAVLTSKTSLRLVEQNSPELDKLHWFRDFPIALCTFGNTSFHNKDLSHTDFTNVDLANIDLRATSFQRTCFRGATGLNRARLDDRYFDITNPKVQQLLTQGTTSEPNLNGLNLQGAYLKSAEMTNFTLIDTNITLADLNHSILRNTNLSRANLSGADVRSADLRGSILVQTNLIGADLTEADLTGACIENWNINGRTIFTDIRCDYIYRKLDDTGQPTDRHPRDRDFEPGEFASLYQEVENAVELIFKEGINWRAFAFSLQKLQLDDEGLGLQIRGIEQRGDLWVVKVTHDQNVANAVVEAKLEVAYETIQRTLAAKEQQINQLLGIMTDQAEALKELSKKPFGNQFNITGSTITNLAGSGQIEYTEAANQVRNLVAHTAHASQSSQIAQQLLAQIQNHQLASTPIAQAELIRQIILTEAETDPLFKQFILQQSDTLLEAIPQGPIAIAFQTALKILQP
jgi:uncharacterized protein YjbI with pentapeptide repeats